ncbi:acyl-CoA dehydrogenase family protein [Novosphingobium lentum]|uniref:acyl-CoA dehydrogenase family protein n=1 Tax=Novosphingobium lentum TaxID=145287 RepID=UPI000829E3AA|nr:acyl-CoA dehydrogenase family protein [Novosphingobium lentum]
MNYDFDAQQIELHDVVARALADALPFDGHEARGADDCAGWAAMAELGLFGLLVPEAYGGLDLSLTDLTPIAQELGERLAPLSIVDTLAASEVIVRHGTLAQQARWLPAIARGELRVAVAWLEPAAGYDPHAMATTVAAGRLNGTKMLVAHADRCEWLLLPVRHGDGSRVDLAMVERTAPGVTLTVQESLDPSCGHHRVDLRDVALAPDALLGGFAPQLAAARLFDVAAALHALLALGIAGAMMSRAADYARERVQFDVPIGSFQAIKHKCADMYTLVEAARAAAYYGLAAVAKGDAESTRAASLAKAYCNDVAARCCQDSIQVHGGMGFTWELGLHRFLRRAKVVGAAFGDPDFHRERVLALTLEAMAQPHSGAARSAA